ncbi:MAG: UDP-galactopyranose mutase [Catonella sp.]|uniref:UDP-galactopyranose mutase n=1 Tax=Catonella sp. TaxID=2382125 RepID=UPI003F9EEFE1
MYDVIIVGAGYAGAVSARRLADKGKKVLILEKRNHIGGNAFDEPDDYGILIHTYGPHIFHTNSKDVYDFLGQFTKWMPYHHKVVGNVYGKFIPIPFNLNSIRLVYDEDKANNLIEKLIKEYGRETAIPILQLRANKDEDIKELAEYVYENVFVKYTGKQWGVKPHEIDEAVTARVPVILTEEDGYFTDEYQAMPSEGYTELFEKMLSHPSIDIRLNTDAGDCIKLEDGHIFFECIEFNGTVIYTGMADELFDRCFGALPYRSLRFEFEHYQKDSYQTEAVVNYTVNEDFTRITEFKKMTGQQAEGTTIMKEYSLNFEPDTDMIPYYAILNDENKALYKKYNALAANYENLYLLGRLAEYKYYNMDAITKKALELCERMV